VAEPSFPSRRANLVADWIEYTALTKAASIGGDTLRDMGLSRGYKVADVELGMNTMSRRAALLGDGYPFKVAAGVAALPDASERAWTALLLMSGNSPLRKSLDIGQAAVHLELVTAEALQSLYGPGTSAMRFAWPSDDGRPPDFPEAIRWLANRMKVPIGNSYRPPYAKDGGVDVVAWRPFPDGRSGFPVLLAQCTLERDFRHKAGDIDVRVWAGWLALDVDPATALAVPDVVAPGEAWNALAARTVVLDRVRLSSLLACREASRDRLEPVRAWCRAAIAGLESME
jgi:hypothetical protein